MESAANWISVWGIWLSLLDDKTMELFTDSCCQKEYKILLIDNMEYNKLPRENRLVIDGDLCEF